MNFSIMLTKGVKGFLTLIVSFLVAQIPVLRDWLVGLIPEEYATMTVAGFVAFLITAITNYLKHKDD